MTDDEVIIKAESLGFKFHKFRNEFRWSVVAPDEDSVTCEQGDPKGMKWLREKLTYFMEPEKPSPLDDKVREEILEVVFNEKMEHASIGIIWEKLRRKYGALLPADCLAHYRDKKTIQESHNENTDKLGAESLHIRPAEVVQGKV
jgi:hypothetical protein